MGPPAPVREAVGRALAERGLGTRVERVRPVGGGCISHGALVESDTGAKLFLKWNAASPPGMFDAEADGLSALRRAAGWGAVSERTGAGAAARTLRVPEPIAWPVSGEGASWLLLEYVAPGRASEAAEQALGRGLTALHSGDAGTVAGAPTSKAARTPSFGWSRDNWIGSLPQQNAPTASWGDFWRDHRIGPQLEKARRAGYLSTRGADAALERVMEAAPAALADVVRPELVHGDLWGGNWFTSAAGEPVLIDPAVYWGHGEVDLAMSELFGGFGEAFYGAYREAHGVSEAYGAYRRDLYQLYYLLVHVNLFGASYEAGALRAARRVAAAL